MNRVALSLAVLAMLAALAAPAAAEGPASEVIAAASPLARLSEGSLNGRRWDEVAALTEAEQNCQKVIDAALASGMKLNQEFEMERVGPIDRMPHSRENPGEGRFWSNLGLMRAYCKGQLAQVQLLRAYLTVGDAERSRYDAVRSDPSPYRLKLAAANQRACVREVRKALDMKVAPEAKIDYPEVKLGEAQEKVCAPLAVALAAALDKARKQKDLSKFAKLPGDRKKVFEEQGLFAEDVFGEGKTPLEGADDFKYAATWYVALMDHDGFGGPAWLVRSYRFDGDKLAESKEQHFDGEEPPKEIFK